MTAAKLISALAIGSALVAGSVVSAQTVTTTPSGGTTATTTDGVGATPGTPNTGAGGDMTANLAILGAAAVVALLGAGYVSRRLAMR